MIELNVADLLGKAEGGGDFQLHLRPVFRVPAPALGLPVHGHGKGIVPHQLLDILFDAVGVAIFLGFELAPHLVAEAEGDALIHHRLAAQHVPVVFHGDVDVREHLLVRLPVEAGAGLFPVGRLLLQAADVPALLKVEGVFEAVPPDDRIKEFRGVLGGAGAQTVETEGVFVVFPVFAVFAAGVHFAEHQLPVVALLLLVVVHGAAPAKVLHLYAEVLVASDENGVPVALPGFVDGVGEDFKHRVLAALQIVGAEDHRRPLAHPVLALQHGDAGISVLFVLLFRCHVLNTCHKSIVVHNNVIILYSFFPAKSTLTIFRSNRQINWCLAGRLQFTCHCETSAHTGRGNPPVRREMYRQFPYRTGKHCFFGRNRYLVPFIGGIATPVCELARNDSKNSTNTNLYFPLCQVAKSEKKAPFPSCFFPSSRL